MINERKRLTSKQEQIVALMAQTALINSYTPKKEYPVRYKKQDKRLESTKTNFIRSQVWMNKKPLPHESHIKVINGSTWR
jgi:hypothetical protein